MKVPSALARYCHLLLPNFDPSLSLPHLSPDVFTPQLPR